MLTFLACLVYQLIYNHKQSDKDKM